MLARGFFFVTSTCFSQVNPSEEENLSKIKMTVGCMYSDTLYFGASCILFSFFFRVNLLEGIW